ncbi:GGDEF domain-containing protein [Pseudomarimonas salicorniae]|uniref:diguanylate cyclase n=1 Tax=Pseudomarimonas salicorniae TaxID=2933270 RepID=A0ABT0GJK2_9GAMM|nr:GGDEF domain-containing protein [Lysobacter sp. CAU 1642]MCK7594195.1 GGDEF domain-containing protein [Lysobacter sp. CAU 1642]
MIELLLWQWSTAVQISSTLLIALFFIVYARSAERPELRWWVNAWTANALAMTVTWAFWMIQPGDVAKPFLLALYFTAKTGFLVLILLGVIGLDRVERAARLLLPLGAGVLVFGLAGGALITQLETIGVFQASLIAVILGVACWQCLRRPQQGLGWLALGCGMRAALGAAEAIGYGWRRFGAEGSVPDQVGVFLAAHSSFDTGAEWVIALGCVLAITHRVHAEMLDSHAELGRAHEALRVVAERDPLTGLYNRRMLKPLLEAHRDRDLEVLFLDLDEFKRINDTQGHDIGDACLKRFADALRKHLSGALATIRFAGDEFVVIGPPGMSADVLPALREELARSAPGLPALGVSIGRTVLPRGGAADKALREADAAMYREKASRPDRRQG